MNEQELTLEQPTPAQEVSATEASDSIVPATVLLALALAVGALVVWFVKKLHGSEVQDTLDMNDSLTKFRELHARGGLSDEEYRTIKTKLAADLESELGDSAKSSET